MVATITREELQAKLNQNDDFVLVETLPADVYQSGHLPGAINLPFETPEQIKEIAPHLLPDKNADIVVYCMSQI